jgi:cysteine-rich repeat protein
VKTSDCPTPELGPRSLTHSSSGASRREGVRSGGWRRARLGRLCLTWGGSFIRGIADGSVSVCVAVCVVVGSVGDTASASSAAASGADGRIKPARCGDGFVRAGVEQCDDGNTLDGDGCNHRCTIDGCGDGLIQFALGETCDDGNTVTGDGCDDACQVEPFLTIAPVRVSAELSCTTTVANAARKIAIDGNGTIYAVMTCGSDAYVVASKSRGVSYSAPVSLSADLPNAPVTVGQVAVAAGPTGIAYVAMMLTSGEVYLKTTLDYGDTWSTAVLVGTADSTSAGLSLQAFNDDIYIGFASYDGIAVTRNHNQGSGGFAMTSVSISIVFFDLLYDARSETLIIATDTPEFHVRSSTDYGVTFGSEVNPPGYEYYSDWALGNSKVYVSGTDLYPEYGNSTLLFVIPTSDLTTSTSVSGLPMVSDAQTRTLAADTSGNAYVASQLDGGGVQLDRLAYNGSTLDMPRSLSATGGSPVVGPLPGGTGAAVVYTDGTSVYVTIQAY